MAIGIAEEHGELAAVAADFMKRHGGRESARLALEATDDVLPAFWDDLCGVGWLGLHLSEQYGGSGYGLAELVVVVEELGASMAAGPYVPSVIASAVIAGAAPEELRQQLLPELADGSLIAGIALDSELELRDGLVYGSVAACVSGGQASVFVLPLGDDVVVLGKAAGGIEVSVPKNLDPSRRSAQLTIEGARAEVLVGARRSLVDIARLIFAAEAVGLAQSCVEQASAYAKMRLQFGRVIGTFQAVKHHCANMAVAAELATAAVWDAARAATLGGNEFSYAAAVAASLAFAAADQNAQLNIQVHGGIGFTWEHDAHLYLRRATALEAIVDTEQASIDASAYFRGGARLTRAIELPAEAEPIREEVRRFAAGVADLGDDERRDALVESGYAVPSWPKPWGRDAGAVEQLVIEEEFRAAGIKRPSYNITGWVILTLVQHATEEQVSRWVRPALDQKVIWCQLFSEPEAGSDAAGVKTRATKVDGGWKVNGQKVWTSGAHLAGFGMATVRTNTEAPKHQGITTMVIDMHAPGVTVRPLRMTSGASEFNEVFFDDVFVPDDDVVGPIDGGWTVARATLGNESVSIGGGQGAIAVPLETLVAAFDANPVRLRGGAGRLGRHIARSEASGALNLRSVHRAVAGDGPGPEGAISKLLLTENLHEASAILVDTTGPAGAFLDGDGALSGALALMHRGMSIAGGTSEIKRNQIGERILGLPRDPLIN
ncbi:MAG: putative acyl-CoA dehydrogenase [Mycobacterium sp.]|nr:putative acyl-CoA dehydrogenase [Mycobacterium sp.]